MLAVTVKPLARLYNGKVSELNSESQGKCVVFLNGPPATKEGIHITNQLDIVSTNQSKSTCLCTEVQSEHTHTLIKAAQYITKIYFLFIFQ